MQESHRLALARKTNAGAVCYAAVFTLMNTFFVNRCRSSPAGQPWPARITQEMVYVCFLLNSAAFAVYDAFLPSVSTKYAAEVPCASVTQ